MIEGYHTLRFLPTWMISFKFLACYKVGLVCDLWLGTNCTTLYAYVGLIGAFQTQWPVCVIQLKWFDERITVYMNGVIGLY